MRKQRDANAAVPPDIPIREIRGQRVLLDSDLAAIYGVARNQARFPADFMFRLTREEFDSLRSQIATLSTPGDKAPAVNSSQIAMSSKKHRGSKYLPFAFTEHGALQAANILKSE